MRIARIGPILCVLVVLIGPSGELRAQPAPHPPVAIDDPASAQSPNAPPDAESQPTTRAVSADDPQHSPRATIREFLLALNDSRTRPERIKDALACLQLTQLEPPAQERAPQLAERLAAVIDEVFRRTNRNTDSVPDEPLGEPYTLAESGAARIVLALQEDGRWRFTAESLAGLDTFEQASREATATQPVEPTADASVPPEFRSPRATMDTFLRAFAAKDIQRAATCLDLSALNPASRTEVGQQTAKRLKEAIALIKPVVLQDVPDTPSGGAYSFYLDESGRIEIARQESGERKGCWLFSQATVDKIESLHKVLSQRETPSEQLTVSFFDNPSKWIRARLPDDYEKIYFKLEHWQWIGIAILILLGDALRRILTSLLTRGALPFLRTRETSVIPAVAARALRPVAVVIVLLLWWAGVGLLDLSIKALPYVVTPLKVALVVAIVWSIYNLVDLFISTIIVRIQTRAQRTDNVVGPLIQKTLKVVVLVIGVVWFVRAIGFHVEPLLTGLGIGGLAFGLAAQDTLKSFFGSVNVALDRPFQVGDWVKIGAVEGAVESVGLRSSRLRTFHNSEVTVPNSEIVNAVIDNFGRRRFRRVFAVLGVEYGTPPEKLEAFCEGVRDVIRKHAATRKDDFQVFVDSFGDSSINIRIACLLDVPDHPTELEQKHNLLLDILRLAERIGVQFAFPTRTLHLRGDGATTSAPLDAVDPLDRALRRRETHAHP